MYTEHPYFDTPSDAMTLWRYMAVDKLKSLLERSALFFARARALEDSFEGSLPGGSIESRRMMLEELRTQMSNDPAGYEKARANVERLSEATRGQMREVVCLSCWYNEKRESGLMWQAYARNGVAVRTTVGRLKAAAMGSAPVMIGSVAYGDYKTLTIPLENVFYPFLFKRPRDHRRKPTEPRNCAHGSWSRPRCW